MMEGWRFLYGVLWDVLWLAAIGWLIFGGGLRRVIGFGHPSSLPETPRRKAAVDFPEFRDADRR